VRVHLTSAGAPCAREHATPETDDDDHTRRGLLLRRREVPLQLRLRRRPVLRQVHRLLRELLRLSPA
jgi:hypothetical protein